MTDQDVVKSFNNAWRALCKQYKKYPKGGCTVCVEYARENSREGRE